MPRSAHLPVLDFADFGQQTTDKTSPRENSIVGLVSGPFADAISQIWSGPRIGEYLSASDARRHVWHSWLSSTKQLYDPHNSMAGDLAYARLNDARGKDLIEQAYGRYPHGIGASQRFYDPLGQGINDLQELSKTHDAVARMKTETLHRILTHYLPLYFPEIERFRHNSRSDWFFAFLERFPTPGSITASDKGAFIAAAWEVVGRKVSKTRLLGDIYETARSSIALPVPLDSPAIAMFRLILAEMRSLIRQRDQIETFADQLLKDRFDYQCLKLVPGVGPIIALTILAEAGDLRRFGHHRQFLKFCGLDLETYQSGKFRGQTKLSKYGNARLRRALWMAGQVAIRQKENSFRDKFERYVARDRGNADLRRKALTAVTAKMARVVHAVVKSGTEYRPFFEGGGAKRKNPSQQCREGATATL